MSYVNIGMDSEQLMKYEKQFKACTIASERTADEKVMANIFVALGLVDAPVEDAFDKYTRLVSTFIVCPVALVSFVQEEQDRQYFKSQSGLDGKWAASRQTPLSHSFCQYVKRDNRPLIVEDAPSDARVCGNLAIPDLGVRAYLGVPIHALNGVALGALCAIDVKPRIWHPSDLDVMLDLAACVSDQIGLRELRHGHRSHMEAA